MADGNKILGRICTSKKNTCSGKEQEKTKYVFEKLTPITDCSINVYEEAIDFAFSEEDVKNIAISGAYGAGKSSVLASYKNKHTKTFAHISLAHFRNEGLESPIKESILEGKILNQLIHQIPSKKIPQTNFRVKSGTSTCKMLGVAVGFITFLLALIHILYFSSWCEYVSTLPEGRIRSIIEMSTKEYSLFASGIICAFLAFVFVLNIVKAQKYKNIFRKFNFQGAEIEIFEDTDESYFDKYLNEVLYLFERVDADAIVFEDMDRFEVNCIFERLREINTLVNQQRVKDRKPILRFFYLLRDDIFISKDRTKFFDYIIPVVPVIDGTNSFNQFIDHLGKNNLIGKFDRGFLQGVSLYVDDMRLLKNICNEFLIYHSRLNIIELDYNKMLAMIIYKNLFPREFCDLQLGKGFVHSLFLKKPDFVKQEIYTIEQQLKALEDRRSAANDEHLISIEELDTVYAPKINRHTRLLNAEDQVTYDKRKQAIEDKYNNKIAELDAHIAELRERNRKLNSLSLSEVITRANVDEVFNICVINEIGTKEDFKEIKGSDYFPLLKYLIRNGLIDESYADYMTYFYENSLSRGDKVFLRSITDRKAKEADYQLKSPEMVFDRLRTFDFSQEEVLNYDLVNFIIDTKPESEAFTYLVDQLRKTGNYTFIVNFYDVVREKEVYVKRLNSLWPELFTNLLLNDAMPSDKLKEYSVTTLCDSSNDEIEAINIDGKLTKYISDSPDYLEIEEPQVDRLISRFKLIEVSFSELDYSASDRTLFDRVYCEGLYDLTFGNIKLMFQKQFGIVSTEEIYHRNITHVLKNKQSPLYTKVQDNMQEYICIVLDNCNKKISDDEEIAEMVLNSDNVDNAEKERYIDYLVTPITSLCKITSKDIWKKLIESSTLLVTEENIMEYFLPTKQITPELVAFINRGNIELDCRCLAQYPEADRQQLFDCVISCAEISNAKYQQMITSLGFDYDENFDVQKIPNDKMGILIDTGIVSMNKGTLLHMRKYYPNALFHYISSNLEQYVDLIDPQLFVHEELLEILDWNVDDSVKLRMLALTEDAITIIDRKYSLAVRVYILQHNLNEEDMLALFHSYHSQEVDIQSIIFKYAIRNIHEVGSHVNIVSILLIQQILTSSDVRQIDKVYLVVKLLPQCDREQACSYLRMSGLEDYCKIFDTRTRPKYEINESSKELLKAFRQNGWISEFEEDNERHGYYKIRRSSRGNLAVKVRK